MADLRIDKDKAERLVALILRDTMLPADANALASNICNRLYAAMELPVKPGLRGYMMIQDSPPYNKRADFTAEVSRHLANGDEDTAEAVWKMVYSYGRKVPDDIVIG
jgi:hypothetical protein